MKVPPYPFAVEEELGWNSYAEGNETTGTCCLNGSFRMEPVGMKDPYVIGSAHNHWIPKGNRF